MSRKKNRFALESEKMTNFEDMMENQFSGPAQGWCPHCHKYYDANKEHECPKGEQFNVSGFTASAGYTCPNCNQWVDYGSFHYCSAQPLNSGFKFELVLSPAVENKLDKILELLETMLEKEIEWRYGSVEEFLDDIEDEDASNR